MKPPPTRRHHLSQRGHPERGVTIILVAISMVGILAMAALSIDVVTLYLARLEAQRSADAAALTAARIISISGITGDPQNTTANWGNICGGAGSPATLAAQAVAYQNTVGGIPASSITVNYSAGGSTSDNCSGLSPAFGVNPMVTVQVTRPALPTLFSRIWGAPANSVSATATAEAFNPSNSATGGNTDTGSITPVQPRCVKPWVVANLDPLNGSPTAGPKYCNQTGGPGPCASLTNLTDGSITHPGISLLGSGNTGAIGEEFSLVPDCHAAGPSCSTLDNPPVANNSTSGSPIIPRGAYLEYLPGQVLTSSIAAPTTGVDACSDATSDYAKAITGCDQTTIYKCGVPNGNTVDLSENPRSSGDAANGVRCLIHQATPNSINGQDLLDITTAFPYTITAGSDYPVTALRGDFISSSTSLASLPIYDNSVTINPTGTTNVTVIGFLQVFIKSVDPNGVLDVVVLNVAGCGNGANPPRTAVTGSSPVPVRLITPP